jgi:pimeloyl-ACP methyl ester carboxylesterase
MSHSCMVNPEETTMKTLTSRDGTTIAYDKQGEGPALILVDGALTVHSSGSGAELAKLLAPHFTVHGFDRRGRGESGDTLPYAVDREIDDIEALIDRAGGPAFLYGHSSGGPLAMRAAIRLGSKVSKIAMYEPPYNNDPGAQESWSQYLRQLRETLAEGRRGDAVALFMRFVGTPAEQIDLMRRAVLAGHGSRRADAGLRPRRHPGRALVGADRGGRACLGARPRDGGRREPSVHARRGAGAEPGDPARPAADTGGSDA